MRNGKPPLIGTNLHNFFQLFSQKENPKNMMYQKFYLDVLTKIFILQIRMYKSTQTAVINTRIIGKH